MKKTKPKKTGVTMWTPEDEAKLMESAKSAIMNFVNRFEGQKIPLTHDEAASLTCAMSVLTETDFVLITRREMMERSIARVRDVTDAWEGVTFGGEES